MPSNKKKNQSKHAHSSKNKLQPSQQQVKPASPAAPAPAQITPRINSANEEALLLLLEKATEAKVEGNAAFGLHNYDAAIECYTKGLKFLLQDTDACSTSNSSNTKQLVLQLKVQLYSNRAQAHIKQHNYEAAETDCTSVLEDIEFALLLQPKASSRQEHQQQQHRSNSNHKVWYRRAVAREGRASQILTENSARITGSTAADATETAKQDQNEEAVRVQERLAVAAQLLDAALEDLSNCLRHAAADSGEKAPAATVAEVRRSEARIQRAFTDLQKQKQQMNISNSNNNNNSNLQMNGQILLHTNNNSGNNNYAQPTTYDDNDTTVFTTAPLEPQIPPPPIQQQREDIVKLLLSRRDRLNSSPTLLAAGEALYLMDWEWWCDWCHHVRFFVGGGGGETNEASPVERKHLLLQCLPAGAVLPDEVEQDDDDKDEDGNGEANEDDNDNGGTSKADETKKETEEDTSPGVIDNVALLLPPLEQKLENASTQRLYLNHWYQEYHASHHLALRPGLVRGHHYELLPREVYWALRQWYGELTPPILRRVDKIEHCIVLYPLYERPPPPQDISWGPCGICMAPVATKRCADCVTVYYCDRACQERHWKFHKAECKAIVQHKKNSNNDATTTLQRRRPHGRRGLNNMGNTCFMNSALQCLSHATPLTRHFLSGKFQADVNPTNPLGTGGKLALAYEQVMKDLYHGGGYNNMNGNSRSCSPTALKRAIAMFAPRFAGTLQHDAQEFLAYLLDGLHEDLNRIRQAPYVELPDVTADHCLAVAGATAWDAHKRRNDSLVLDTFYGQFKSKCVCPKCDRVSVSFDAFNHVSLEIPQEKNTVFPLSVIVFGGAGRMTKRYGVPVPRTGRVWDVKRALSALCGISVERLIFCEVYHNTIECVHGDNKPVDDLPSEIIAYEVERPLQGPDSANTFHMVVTHRLISPGTVSDAHDNFGIPFFTSFPIDVSCRELWDGIWNIVGDNVEGDDARSLLQIRFVDRDGHPVPFVIEDDASNHDPAENEETTEDEKKESAKTMTSIIPPDSDKLLTSLVREKAAERIVFLHLEWTDPTELEDSAEERKVEPRISMDRFLRFENHSSWIAAEKEQRAKAASARKGVSLDQCFEAFTKPERLDEHNMWYCSTCKEHVRAMKTMGLWKLPNILIVALKRFEFKHALRRDKLDTMVDFPLDGLDMGKYFASRGTSTLVDDHVPAIYDCFGVINHYGRIHAGHYTAFARRWDETGISDDWALFDDSSVRPVMQPKASVVTNAAYVMFYRRRTFN